MKTSVKEPTPAQIAAREELIAVLRRHENLRPDEMLAVSAYFVGQLVALQDQRKMTPDMAMALVAENIQAGNDHAIEQHLGTAAGNA